MKKVVLILLVSVLLSTTANAQRSEAGIFLGGSFYLGDINNSKLFGQTNFAGGLLYRYNLNTHWALKGNAWYGMLKGDDVKYENTDRGLSFRSNVFDFSLQAELNFLNYFTGSKRYYRFTPYIFGGIALFFFNPQAYYAPTDSWQDLKPLSTEGEGLSQYDVKEYSLAQLAIPFGLGFKYSLSKTISVGLEWSMRKTFTDYIDDISGKYVDPAVLATQKGTVAAYFADPTGNHTPGTLRGDSETKDWYSFAGVMLTFKIPNMRKQACDAYKKSGADKMREARR